MIELDPKESLIHIRYSDRARAHLALKKYDLALADNEKALENVTDSTWKLIFMGDRVNIHLAAQKYDAAIAAADKLLATDPKNRGGRIGRGVALRGQGKNDLAIAEFSNLIIEYPNDETAYRERAATYRVVGKSDLAAADESKAERLKIGK